MLLLLFGAVAKILIVASICVFWRIHQNSIFDNQPKDVTAIEIQSFCLAGYVRLAVATGRK